MFSIPRKCTNYHSAVQNGTKIIPNSSLAGEPNCAPVLGGTDQQNPTEELVHQQEQLSITDLDATHATKAALQRGWVTTTTTWVDKETIYCFFIESNPRVHIVLSLRSPRISVLTLQRRQNRATLRRDLTCPV
jgi:hypothetical protein